MDLNKESQDRKLVIVVRNWPCISKHNCPFWNIVAIIFIVVSNHVGNSFGTRQDGT
jgi:hypothetical protein